MKQCCIPFEACDWLSKDSFQEPTWCFSQCGLLGRHAFKLRYCCNDYRCCWCCTCNWSLMFLSLVGGRKKKPPKDPFWMTTVMGCEHQPSTLFGTHCLTGTPCFRNTCLFLQLSILFNSLANYKLTLLLIPGKFT